MTVYDILFPVLFFAVLAALFAAATAYAAGHKRAARFLCGGLAIGAAAYVGAWVAVAALAKSTPLGVGDPQCIDNWCVAVERVQTTPRAATNLYDVTLCLFSRANRAPTSFGAHAAAGATTDVYLTDHQGRSYYPLPHPSEIPLDAVLQPGEVLRTRRVFELPAGARNIGLLAAGGSWGACPMIGECSTTHSASGYVLAQGVYRPGSPFLALVGDLKRNAQSKPPQWR